MENETDKGHCSEIKNTEPTKSAKSGTNNAMMTSKTDQESDASIGSITDTENLDRDEKFSEMKTFLEFLYNAFPQVDEGYRSSRVNNEPLRCCSFVSVESMRKHIVYRVSKRSQAIKLVTVVPDERGKYGFKVEELDDCIFINFISSGSPAQANGLRFGDQVLHVNGNCAFGRSPSDILKQINDYGCKVPPPPIVIAVRERPLERTITMHKDSEGYLGFQFKFGRIDKIHDESSAARNGLMKNQNITEVNGINVVGLEDEEITKIITDSGNIVTVTIMDPENYKILLKSLPPDMVRKYMDRSINID